MNREARHVEFSVTIDRIRERRLGRPRHTRGGAARRIANAEHAIAIRPVLGDYIAIKKEPAEIYARIVTRLLQNIDDTAVLRSKHHH